MTRRRAETTNLAGGIAWPRHATSPGSGWDPLPGPLQLMTGCAALSQPGPPAHLNRALTTESLPPGCAAAAAAKCSSLSALIALVSSIAWTRAGEEGCPCHSMFMYSYLRTLTTLWAVLRLLAAGFMAGSLG